MPQGLIQWSGQTEDLATWEDLEELKQRFPRATAWGQAAFQGGGNVSIIDPTIGDDGQVSQDPATCQGLPLTLGPTRESDVHLHATPERSGPRDLLNREGSCQL